MSPATSSQFAASGKTLATDRHSVWTAWVETAPGGRVNKAGNLSPRWQTLCALAIFSDTIWVRRRRNKQLRIRMFGPLDDLLAQDPPQLSVRHT